MVPPVVRLRPLSALFVADLPTAASVATRVVVGDGIARDRARTVSVLSASGFGVVGEAVDAAQLVALVLRHRPDLCVLDVELPGGGCRAIAEVTVAARDTLVVVLTRSREDRDLFGALAAGADGYLLKDTDPARLPIALKGAVLGEAAIPRALMARVLRQVRLQDGSNAAEPGVRLTPRETEVLRLARFGLTTLEIATRLYVCPGTVRTHASAARRKLRSARVPIVHGDQDTWGLAHPDPELLEAPEESV